MPDTPTPLSQTLVYVLAAITAVATLLATQSLIDNRIEKLVTGLAGILLPLAWVIGNAVWHLAHARVKAAQTTANASVEVARIHAETATTSITPRAPR